MSGEIKAIRSKLEAIRNDSGSVLLKERAEVLIDDAPRLCNRVEQLEAALREVVAKFDKNDSAVTMGPAITAARAALDGEGTNP